MVAGTDGYSGPRTGLGGGSRPRPGRALALGRLGAALLLATREVARHFAVDEALAAEWADSVPGLHERLERAQRSAAKKGWRWAGEMDEIADTFAAAGQPEGFHRAAAEVYRA